MNSKKWYKSIGIWAGIATTLVSVYETLVLEFASQCAVEGSFCINLPDIPVWLFGVLGSLGIYGRARAKTKIG